MKDVVIYRESEQESALDRLALAFKWVGRALSNHRQAQKYLESLSWNFQYVPSQRRENGKRAGMVPANKFVCKALAAFDTEEDENGKHRKSRKVRGNRK